MSVLTSPWLGPGDADAAVDAVSGDAPAREGASARAAQLELDRGLALRAQAGDQVALRAIYERHAASVQRFLRDMLRASPDEVADALQDTFVRVFQRIAGLDDPSRLVGWIFGIARNVSLEHRRAHSRRGVLGWLGLRAEEDVEGGRDRGEALAWAPSPEAELLGKESAAALARALGELSADRRALLLLRCDHQLSYEEIATAMGFSVAKVKVEIFRARQALRAALFGESEL